MIGMDAFHHEKQLHPLCWLFSGNRFIISIFTSPLIGSWTIDHAPGLAVRVWWCLGESRIKILISLRERWRVHPSQKSQHVLWQPVTSLIDSSIATEISVSQFSWCSQSSWDLGHFSIHHYCYIFCRFPSSKYKILFAARPHNLHRTAPLKFLVIK